MLSKVVKQQFLGLKNPMLAMNVRLISSSIIQTDLNSNLI